MSIPSLQYLIHQATSSFRRFTAVILSAFVASVAGVMLISIKESGNQLLLLHLMLTSALGIPLFISMRVTAEKNGWERKKTILAHIPLLLLLVLLFFSFPSPSLIQKTIQPYLRFALYALTAHLTVSFMPFLLEQKWNGFWQYNRILFLRLFVSLIYSLVLFAGISLAAVAIDQLFGVKVNYKFYGECFTVIAFLFNTWFFVAGIPDDVLRLEENREYPKGLRIFSQYILLSLLLLYLIILYAYGTKIITTWNWPKGMVSYLVVYVSVLGTLSMLLLYPYGQTSAYKWIGRMSKWFYILLLPLLILLYIAIFMRIDDYGITENRYIILALGIWLTIVSVYSLRRHHHIKFIPLSLSILPVVISFGPWSLFSVSEKYQVNRLKHILETNHILINGKIQNESKAKITDTDILFTDIKNDDKLSDSLKYEVLSIMRYLNEYHGFASIQTWFTQDLQSMLSQLALTNKKLNRKININQEGIYIGAMGFNAIVTEASGVAIQLSAKEDKQWMDIRGYDAMMKFNANSQLNLISRDTIKNSNGDLIFFDDRQRDFIWKKDSTEINLQVGSWLDKRVNENQADYQEIPANKMIICFENETLRLQVYFTRVRAVKQQNRWTIDDAEGWLLYHKK